MQIREDELLWLPGEELVSEENVKIARLIPIANIYYKKDVSADQGQDTHYMKDQ